MHACLIRFGTSATFRYPQRSEAYTDKLYIEQYFPIAYRAERVIMVEKKEKAGQALTAPALREAMAFLLKLTDSTAEELCARAYKGGPCVWNSLLTVWGLNMTLLAQDIFPASTLARRPLTTNYNKTIDVETVVGGKNVTYDLSRGASSLMHTLLIDAPPQRGGSRDARSEKAERWELEKFVPTCLGASLEYFDVHCMAEVSWKTENERLQDSNLYIMVLAMLAMIGYVCVSLGAPPWQPVKSKIMLGTCIVLSVGQSLGVAFGLSSYFGVPFTIMSFLAVFIILGVGIDDMFILVGERTRIYKTET
jgi:hypothetical protein